MVIPAERGFRLVVLAGKNSSYLGDNAVNIVYFG